jgi:A/G-specific adenine glycosylase
MARLYAIPSDIRLAATATEIEKRLHLIFPAQAASAFNQGMMELGALICIPKIPRCAECPLQDECLALAQDLQFVLPLRSANKAPQIVERVIVLIQQNGKWLIHHRKQHGLLASMWEFPGVGCNDKTAAEKAFAIEYGLDLKLGTRLFDTEHTFTHRQWQMAVYTAELIDSSHSQEKRFRWVDIAELDDYPIPNAFRKICDYLKLSGR